jgi:two-component system sensor histidine kinase/response regulator
MTANAMKSDIDACFAAGMNDFITKPIERKALLQTLRRWLPARHPPSAASSPSATVSGDGLKLEGIDIAGSLERLGLDFGTFRRMLVKFGDGQPAVLEALRGAVASSDGAAAARHAHAIAGASGNLGADALRAAAKALERAGRDGRTELAHLLDDVESRAAVVFRSIDTLRGSRPADAVEPGQVLVPPAARAPLERLQSALGDYDSSAASTALAELDRIAMPGAAAGELARLRQHIDGYEYEEARALATRLLGVDNIP